MLPLLISLLVSGLSHAKDAVVFKKSIFESDDPIPCLAKLNDIFEKTKQPLLSSDNESYKYYSHDKSVYSFSGWKQDFQKNKAEYARVKQRQTISCGAASPLIDQKTQSEEEHSIIVKSTARFNKEAKRYLADIDKLLEGCKTNPCSQEFVDLMKSSREKMEESIHPSPIEAQVAIEKEQALAKPKLEEATKACKQDEAALIEINNKAAVFVCDANLPVNQCWNKGADKELDELKLKQQQMFTRYNEARKFVVDEKKLRASLNWTETNQAVVDREEKLQHKSTLVVSAAGNGDNTIFARIKLYDPESGSGISTVQLDPNHYCMPIIPPWDCEVYKKRNIDSFGACPHDADFPYTADGKERPDVIKRLTTPKLQK